jgi:hypothetical protein
VILAKTFRKYSPNQELLLDAFEQVAWAREVHDPLPMDDGVIPADRLRETVKRLNRSVEPHTVRFGTTANGRRAYWRAVAR